MHFWKNAVIGYVTGFGLQSYFYFDHLFNRAITLLLGSIKSHPFFPSFAAALTCRFCGRNSNTGIFFRLTEGKIGTVLTLIICVLFFRNYAYEC
jgi:hypothetical protein